MDNLDTRTLLVAGAVIGMVVGVAAQLSQFCSRRALADSFSGNGSAYLKAFGVAMLVAIAATQSLVLTTELDLTDVVALKHQLPIIGLSVGGVMFGAGLMLTGGCPHRLLIRTGQGQLSAVALLIILVLAVMATRDGVLSPVRLWLSESTLVVNSASFDALLSLQGSWIIPAVAVTTAMFLIATTVRRVNTGSGGLMLASAIIGVCVAASWYVSVALADPFELPTPHPLSYIAPTQELVRFFAMSELGFDLKFGTTLVIGTLVGSALSSAFIRSTATRALPLNRRTVTGALLMGFGGVLAQGCTFGQGLAGLSVLSLASSWVVACITLGAWLTYRWLIAPGFAAARVENCLTATQS